MIVVGDTPSSIEINEVGGGGGGALETHPRWRPRSTSAPIRRFHAAAILKSKARGWEETRKYCL